MQWYIVIYLIFAAHFDNSSSYSGEEERGYVTRQMAIYVSRFLEKNLVYILLEYRGLTVGFIILSSLVYGKEDFILRYEHPGKLRCGVIKSVHWVFAIYARRPISIISVYSTLGRTLLKQIPHWQSLRIPNIRNMLSFKIPLLCEGGEQGQVGGSQNENIPKVKRIFICRFFVSGRLFPY